MGIEVSGILGLIVLLLDIYAVIKVINSGAGTGAKVLWTAIIVILPVIGLLLWFFLGPKG
ncbi:PLDc_N domain-containing protein [Leucothrix sargassi]|nr:PLDc_N domain-containing protein [Leucothrix sargassi]